ncbi:MAG: ARPP-1 family domain-containing protein, partial [Terriglobales bacterium]
ILLAGEIVTGGKQDRVISTDRLVLPGSEPLPLDVFCVEPGRWHGASTSFGASLMAAPNVREKAAVAKDQQQVWNATAESRTAVADAAAASPGAAGGRVQEELRRSSSYAQMEASPTIKRRIDDASTGLQRDYERALRGALQGKNVVGVVVAINGEVVWADLFADSSLFQRYWPKLLRSYVVEAMSVPVVEHARASVADAERFISEQQGKQIIEVEPGEYRLVQIDSPRYSIFQLSSLLEKGEPLLHFNKLRKEGVRSGKWVPPIEEPRPMQRHRD